jgi:branched-chain amino acid transport system permease protein
MLGMLIPICAYAIMAVSLNLVVGFLGELSLGHAAFMLAGATAGVVFYNGAGLTMHQVPRVIITLIIGAAAAGVFGVIVGVPVLRFSGDYLAIVTLAFCQILKNVLSTTYLGVDSKGIHLALEQSSFRLEPGAKPLIKGAQPISGINKISPNMMISFTVGIVLLLLTVTFVLNLMNSRAGRAITAIRDDEIASEAMGISLSKHKMISFVISSFFAGIGGGLFAMYVANAQAKAFTSTMTYEILLIVVVGGIGSISGSIIATFLYVACSEWWLRFLDSEMVLSNGFKVPLLRNGFRMVVFSVVIMVIVLFSSHGIMGDRELRLPGINGRPAGQKKVDKGKVSAAAAGKATEEKSSDDQEG